MIVIDSPAVVDSLAVVAIVIVVVVVGLHQLFFIRVLCPVVLRYDPPVCLRQSQS